jgi:hypothetical protein
VLEASCVGAWGSSVVVEGVSAAVMMKLLAG